MPSFADVGEAASEFALVVTDLDGTTLAFLDAHGLRYTRRINGHCELSFKAATDDPNAAHLAIGNRAVRLYRNGTLRFMGLIGEPFVDEDEWVTCTAYDPFYFLRERRIGDENLTPVVYTAEDAGAIAWDLISDDASVTGVNNVRQGTIQTSVDRDRTYEPGKPVAEAITQLAEVDDGFYFRMDVYGVGTEFATFNVLYPDAGTDRPGARFEFGDGSLGNIDEGLELERFLPVNSVIAAGGVIPETGVRAGVEVHLTNSQLEYPVFRRWLEFSDISDSAVLREHALDALRGDPVVAVRFDALEGAPALFDDFDVGDTVRVRVDNGRVTYEGALRVNQVTLEVDDETGTERLTGIVAESPFPQSQSR